MTPATVLSDVPTAFLTKENEPYRPMNYDRMWHGPISLRRALATSSNMIAVKVLNAVGVDAMVDTAHALGITTLNDQERYGLALTLGGGEVKLLELTAAYAAFANAGKRVTPVAILEDDTVTRWQGDKVTPDDPITLSPRHLVTLSEVQAVSPQVAYLITDILSDDQARLPAFGENSVLKLSRPAAAKTGTTTDWRDNWTIGYTPDLAVGVWVGNADNSPMQFISGITGAGPIWHDFMEEVLKGKPVRHFARPDGLVEVEVCESSGLLPTRYCERRKRELFIKGTEPKEYDTSYQPFDVDAATGLAWADGCQGPRVQRVYRLLPPEAQDWGRKNGIPEPLVETCQGTTNDERRTTNEDDQVTRWQGDKVTGSSAVTLSPGHLVTLSSSELVVTSPAPNTTFALSPQLPRDFQSIEVAARSGSLVPLRQVTLLVDGQPLATLARPPYRVMWRLQVGAHQVRAVGVDADGRPTESEPVSFTVLEKEPGHEQ
jgi:membrane carboxypeptidase/penicillin-binding protein PbpC